MTIQSFLTQLCEHCGLETDQVSIDMVEEESSTVVTINLPEEESGLFIGYRGETLASIQRMVRLVFQEEISDKILEVTVNDYRERRRLKLKELVEGAAEKVLETGRPHTFSSYFPSNERFLIHSIISSEPAFSELESISSGEGKTRLLTIQLKSKTN